MLITCVVGEYRLQRVLTLINSHVTALKQLEISIHLFHKKK
jgi:hypothetical protein